MPSIRNDNNDIRAKSVRNKMIIYRLYRLQTESQCNCRNNGLSVGVGALGCAETTRNVGDGAEQSPRYHRKRKQHDSRNYGVYPRTDGMTGFIDTIDDRRRDDRGERTEQSEDKYYVGGRYQHALTEVVLAARRSSGIGVTLAADYRIRQRLRLRHRPSRLQRDGRNRNKRSAAPGRGSAYCTGGRATLPCFRRRSWLRSFFVGRLFYIASRAVARTAYVVAVVGAGILARLLNGALDA